VVVGLPVTDRGDLRRRQTDSQQGRRCRHFADALAALAVSRGVRVFLCDERNTTADARALMSAAGANARDIAKRKDSVAAALILGTFFDNPGGAVRMQPPKVPKLAT
jgi:RNase H-fold protein (predicted Holliday junction resolvase)